MNTITVAHNFETAHRLPQLGGKCASLHGHSWWTQVSFIGTVGRDGTIAEFGELKKTLRAWVDTNLDHGTMLGVGDPLVAALADDGCKVFRFGTDKAGPAEAIASDLFWPSVENVAVLIARVATLLFDMPAGVQCSHVLVRETAVNFAEWTR